MHACRASAAAWRAAANPRRCPTPCPMLLGQSRSVRAPDSSSAAMASCLALNLAGLNLLAHLQPAHPSPRRKRARRASAAQARARPASTSAQQPTVRHVYTDLADAASPCTHEFGVAAFASVLAGCAAAPFSELRCLVARSALRLLSLELLRLLCCVQCHVGPDKNPSLMGRVTASVSRAHNRVISEREVCSGTFSFAEAFRAGSGERRTSGRQGSADSCRDSVRARTLHTSNSRVSCRGFWGRVSRPLFPSGGPALRAFASRYIVGPKAKSFTLRDTVHAAREVSGH
eukprot:CAMPEP_0115864498 /NCGR_PEP_ID=MMETSP0287-20121206/19233_1 /TAXON_ID=412157 /ORGANISM="Chrysochromulina rotalis, Strain UIO044" /LENGTH=287 /DNA_ID=CAMNT_0003318973 /DNA_START=104 /DNA_END=966 /DNA_ORIENTATION=-